MCKTAKQQKKINHSEQGSDSASKLNPFPQIVIDFLEDITQPLYTSQLAGLYEKEILHSTCTSEGNYHQEIIKNWIIEKQKKIISTDEKIRFMKMQTI